LQADRGAELVHGSGKAVGFREHDSETSVGAGKSGGKRHATPEGYLCLVELAERGKGIGLVEKMHWRVWIHRNRFCERPERSIVFVHRNEVAQEVAAKLAQRNARFPGGAGLESTLDSMGLSSDQLEVQLEHGLVIQGHRTRPARAWRLEVPPGLPPRQPPIRFRKSVPDCWIALELVEGRNRQVRRMTAAIGHPTLRLVRVQIGGLVLGDLPPGRWVALDEPQRKLVLSDAG